MTRPLFCLLLAVGAAFVVHPARSEVATMEALLTQAYELEAEGKSAEIIDLLQPHARSGNADIGFALATAYMDIAIGGREPESVAAEDMQPAIESARRAASHGSAGALNLLYLIHANGWGVVADPDRANLYLSQAVAAGDPGAKLNYAVALYQGQAGIARDLDRACPIFDELMKLEIVRSIAAYYMGHIVFRGQCGRVPNRVGGMLLIREAAEAEVRDAERDMGRSLEFGWNGERDLSQALGWYERAAGHGEPHSQWRMGMAHVSGERPTDARKAVSYFEKSSLSGFPDGMVSLGVMYATGDGVEVDLAKTRSLYEQAAALGHPHAHRSLAVMHALGQDVPVDLVRARLLYLQAVALGLAEEPGLRDAINARLQGSQKAESDRAFSTWQQARSGAVGKVDPVN